MWHLPITGGWCWYHQFGRKFCRRPPKINCDYCIVSCGCSRSFRYGYSGTQGKIGTDDLESSIGVKLGSFQNIALEQIKENSNITQTIFSAVQVTYNKDSGITTNAKAGFEDDKRSLTADVTLKDGEISTYGVEGSLVRNDKKYAVDVNNPVGQKPNVNLTVETKEGVHTQKSGINYDAENNSFTTSNSFSENVAGGTLYTTNTVDGTRGFRNEAEWEGSVGDGWDLRSGYADQLGIDHQRTRENSLGFTYTGKELTAALDAKYNTNNVGSYEGSLGWKGDSLTANTSFSGGTNQSHLLNADVEKRFGAHKQVEIFVSISATTNSKK